MGKSKLTEPTHSELLAILHEQSLEARLAVLLPKIAEADEQFGPISYKAATARFAMATALSLGNRYEEGRFWALEALPIYIVLLEADPENPRYWTEQNLLRGVFGL